MKFILAKKLNMSRIFTEDGENIPVTVLEAGPCTVVQVKSKDKDGYVAVQLGFGKKRKLNKAQTGHQKGSSFAHLSEFRTADTGDYKSGQTFSAADFSIGELVDASGIMKGRGFAGAVKRHGFHGAPASHGHDHPRAVGSIGSRFPQHTLKGTRMAGRMGGKAVTVKNLMIVDVNPEKNLIAVSGAVPGSRGGLVKIKTNGKTAKAVHKVFEPNPKVEAAEPAKAEEAKTEPSAQDQKAESKS